ncbi:ParD-like family protein [Aestuariicella sp. G3-2]|uniref:ParD-like family protein n=1 Tax=Pseudomaricurvus albidus TaxID=2842452 RepID=UPI001C0B19EE|nr:ParD-like family protein [Aestuariicella albida]MBU3071336.1 ParD-like family protein [Aestuariicella albida]
MAKAASPIRLESSLMDAAKVAGKALHRSASEQVEYWADIGRKVSKVIDPETLLEINAGLVKISLERVVPISVDPDAVFAALDGARESGSLQAAIASNAIQYQASSTHPGLLEQVHPDGTILVGQFQNGCFEPVEQSGKVSADS